MSLIIVNATAARTSGALSILKQFVKNIPLASDDYYYIFVDPDISIVVNSDCIEFIHVDTKSWLKRIAWDAWGIKNWLSKRNIKPSLIISLQNTGINYSEDIPQLIYYHQILPLSRHKWDIWKKEEFPLFVYKCFYSFFVSLYRHEKSYFIVQIPSIKEAFLKKFNVDSKNVFVIPPEIPNVSHENLEDQKLEIGKTHFIYPATLFVYKNHRLLLQALHILKEEESDVFNNIRIHFTLGEEDLNIFPEFVDVVESVVCEGVVPFNKLLDLYSSSDALLFPSYIESFGLPLLEAAGVGIPIIASDLPYVHDVVGEYHGITYANYKNAREWATEMKKVCNDKKRYLPFLYPKDRGSWGDFFELVERLRIK